MDERETPAPLDIPPPGGGRFARVTYRMTAGRQPKTPTREEWEDLNMAGGTGSPLFDALMSMADDGGPSVIGDRGGQEGRSMADQYANRMRRRELTRKALSLMVDPGTPPIMMAYAECGDLLHAFERRGDEWIELNVTKLR